MRDSRRTQLLNQINTEDFVLKEITHFLNTHPCHSEALEYYRQHRDCLKELTKQYTMQFGPLTANNADVTDTWTWATDPWPWEKEDCK